MFRGSIAILISSERYIFDKFSTVVIDKLGRTTQVALIFPKMCSFTRYSLQVIKSSIGSVGLNIEETRPSRRLLFEAICSAEHE